MAFLSIPHILPRIQDKHLEFKKYLNWLLVLMERRANSEVVRAMPFEVTIDPSTFCQLSCPYCSVGSGTITRERKILRSATHQQIIGDLSENLFIAWYFSTGEPLLNRALPEIIAANRGQEIYSIISTNLSLKLSDERIDQILLCGLGCISVSIDGTTAETYSRYRVGGDFDLVMHNLRRLIERKRALNLEFPHIEWRFLVFRHNAHEIAQARAMAQEIGVDLLEFFHGSAPPDATDQEVQAVYSMDLEDAVSGPAIERAARRAPTAFLKARQANPSILSRSYPPVQENGLRQKCDWLYFGSTLFPNGSISPCCVSNHEPDDFGRLSEDRKFKDIWNNPLYREARSLWVNKKWHETERVCARCPDSKAQDYQFRTTLRALLSNAPDWVLKVLLSDLNRFFFNVDQQLSPHETDILLAAPPFLKKEYTQEAAWLTEAGRKSSENAERIAWMRQVVERPNKKLFQTQTGFGPFIKNLIARFRPDSRV